MVVKNRVQIVGRIPAKLSRRVRGVAKRQQISLNAFLIDALTQAVGWPRRAVKPEESQ